MNRKIISCNIHDHFEVACMHRSTVHLVLHNGDEISGKALDLETKNKSEYLHIKSVQETRLQLINLIDIKTLQIDDSDQLIEVS